MRPDLSRPIAVHIVGIGGAGMSAIAAVLSAMGHTVSGSDLKESPALERLRTLGVAVAIGHDASHIVGAELVTASPAVPSHNVELAAAIGSAIPFCSRAEMLAAITALRRTIAVAGTHGKTTTTSMLSLILLEAGLDPSFLVGGELPDVGTNAVWGEGEWLAVEADESDGTFLDLEVELAVVTNVEPDHLDHFGSFAAERAAFARFVARADRSILSADDPVARQLSSPSAVTVGTADDADLRIIDFSGGRSSIAFDLAVGTADLGRFELPVPGLHNARNAAAAVAVARTLAVDPDVARRALARFAGVARRFEFRGSADGVTVVDDYAHLPSELAATLAAARAGGWRRLVCVFQPHRYSRVAALAHSFADAFVDADLVAVTSIYAAGETPLPGVSGKLIVDVVVDAHPEIPIAYLPTRADLLAFLLARLEPGDCCLTCSAGDLTSLPDELIAALEQR